MHDYTSQTGGVQVSASLSGDQTAWGGMLGQIATTTTNINSNPPSSYPLSGTCLFNSLTLSHSCPFCYSSGFLTCLIFRRALQWSFITSKAFQVASTTLTPLKFWPNVLREETAIDDVIRGVRPAILRYSYRDAETNQSTTSLVTAAFS